MEEQLGTKAGSLGGIGVIRVTAKPKLKCAEIRAEPRKWQTDIHALVHQPSARSLGRINGISGRLPSSRRAPWQMSRRDAQHVIGAGYRGSDYLPAIVRQN